MTRFAAILLSATLVTGPALAQEAEDEGGGLMRRGAELFFEGLRDELDPALRDLQELGSRMGPAFQSFIEEMGPALTDLMDEVKDWSVYHPPEKLPNGDIIIRRKETEPEAEPDAVPMPAPENRSPLDDLPQGPEIEL